jgi:plastocyanin
MTSESHRLPQSDQRLVIQSGALFAVVGFLLALAAITAVVFAGHYNNTAAASPGSGQSAASAAAAPQRTTAVTWSMYADSNQKVKGPDGKWHDGLIPGNPTVLAGKVTVTALNYDTSVHTITAPALGLAEKLPPAHGNTPGKLTFTFTATNPGQYQWFCIEPCDPWAMTHNGYMRGSINVIA